MTYMGSTRVACEMGAVSCQEPQVSKQWAYQCAASIWQYCQFAAIATARKKWGALQERPNTYGSTRVLLRCPRLGYEHPGQWY